MKPRRRSYVCSSSSGRHTFAHRLSQRQRRCPAGRAHRHHQVLRLVSEALEADFGRWQDFDKSARTAAHSASGVIELMPVADARDYAFKYVNGHPHNPRLGLPTVMAFGALADVATGMPRFVSELTLTTALRTAATSAMAARHLARAGNRSMALIGNGSQSEFQALAFMELLGVRELRLFDIDPAASQKLLRNLQPFLPGFGATAIVCTGVRDAVAGTDIVTTATADKTRATIIPGHLLEPGMHINAVGGDCPGKTEFDASALQRAQVFVEYEPQTRIEGEPATDAGRLCRDRAVARAAEAGGGPDIGRPDHPVRLRGLRTGGLLGAAHHAPPGRRGGPAVADRAWCRFSPTPRICLPW